MKINQVKLQQIMRNKFCRWRQVNNFPYHPAGRILILWDLAKVIFHVLEVAPQIIPYDVTCKVTSIAFCIGFAYTFHTIVT